MLKFKSLSLTILCAVVISLAVTSCSKKEDFTNLGVVPVANLENGLVFRKASLKNQQVTFQLFDDDGNEILEDVTYYVDENALDNNTFLSDVEGTFEIYARFLLNGEEVVTETETFDVITPVKKVVVEDYTGTWCGYCPSVTAAIEEVLAQTTHVSVVAIHNGDDLSLPIEPVIRDGLGIPDGSPRARIDRTIVWGTPSPANFPVDEVLPYAGIPSNTSIAIQSNIQGGTIFATVTVASEDVLEGRKLVLYLVEDGILRDQTNYYNQDPDSPYFNMGDPIVNFEHNHTLRGNLSDVLGDAIPDTPALTDYVADFSFSMDPEFVAENLHLVAMVVDSDNLAINSQNALVGEEKPFE
ncbi:Omp28-related outer membrane protein [Aureitalea sp. L0-47]|uniref:Omp28-related outer membrane protein n=1 Tax=Aureitalea sp. L0-47 TaxID=2816962 RepID=UPI0022388314|nr:Omp28-related outer membrane protein [Aureitalea sp. L0-47]MCW5518265.1 Omp28-related outer membrane protein [Aureitalea sp. L0-47]